MKITDHDTMAWPKNGIHTGIPFGIYRSDDITRTDTWETAQDKAVSKSLIIDFMEDPGTWRHGVQKETTAAMGFGSLVDCLLLEPEKFASRYALSPFDSFRTKDSQQWRDEMAAAGVEVMTQDKFDMAKSAVDAVLNHPEAARLLNGSRNQVAFRYDTRHGLASKGLIDIVPTEADTLVDLKTCSQSALESYRSLAKHCHDWNYHLQAGSYLDGWAEATGEERMRFKFIFVTSTAPFRCAVIELPYAAILLGAQQYQAGIAKFADCLQRDVWPSIWDNCVELDLPAYAYTEKEDVV
jgi:exodeoxyribonuclease VIII